MLNLIYNYIHTIEKKKFSLSGFFAETPIIKDRLTKEKQTRLLIYTLHVYIRDTKEK